MPARWRWDDQKRRAFRLYASGEHTQAEVAALVGVSRRTMEGWTRRAAWRRLEEDRQAAEDAAIFARIARQQEEMQCARQRIEEEELSAYRLKLRRDQAKAHARYVASRDQDTGRYGGW